MAEKNVAIIGAGIAGMTVGCYLQMNGYHTEIYEAYNVPGGLCTGWSRNGYQIEGCIHGLLGSAPGHPLYRLWNEIIDMEAIRFIDSDIKQAYYFADGSSFIEYASLERLKESMKSIAPEDSGMIDEFIGDIRKLQSVELPYDKPKEFADLPGKLKLMKNLPLLPVVKKWLNVSAESFAKRIINSRLRNVVSHFSSPVLFEMFVLSEMDQKRCGYPTIGSLEFAKLFEQKYLSLGGKIQYNQRVSQIIADGQTVKGIRLGNHSCVYADTVISAADGRTTIYELLGGKYNSAAIKKEYEAGRLNPSKIQISIGVNAVADCNHRAVKLVLASPLIICDGSEYNAIDILIYHSSDGLAPKNKTLLVVQLDTYKCGYWTELRKRDKDLYNKEKNKLAQNIIVIADSRLGNIRENVEMVDVATPATYVRYTGNWNGSVQGWANENLFKTNPFKKQLPGLDNFYLTGQWVEPGGGVPAVFKSGRDLAQIICRRDKKRFSISPDG
jgi:phytoene dehydrogenase-like protein